MFIALDGFPQMSVDRGRVWTRTYERHAPGEHVEEPRELV
jgi:hypothetical protein